jgi:hypothetical protein
VRSDWKAEDVFKQHQAGKQEIKQQAMYPSAEKL